MVSFENYNILSIHLERMENSREHFIFSIIPGEHWDYHRGSMETMENSLITS